ncbi:MAG: tRNA (N(6)-L-threonylcarbamoyladenosine(37)-C(2))-methylthiotransferase MtaB, partial [Clostridia bacterium]|nr:tRNA (N(6)-L-threonylcarbamoyladenosine(37)-C(2))-methylthiotransferase MtaB [Clostridia bacterium]
TYDFCKKMQFADIHCFEYSPREGTVGYKLKQLDPEVKKARLYRLLGLKAKLKNAFLEKHIGTTSSFVPEEYKDGFTEGYTGNYIRVYVEGKVEPGGVKNVILGEKFKDGLKGKSI